MNGPRSHYPSAAADQRIPPARSGRGCVINVISYITATRRSPTSQRLQPARWPPSYSWPTTCSPGLMAYYRQSTAVRCSTWAVDGGNRPRCRHGHSHLGRQTVDQPAVGRPSVHRRHCGSSDLRHRRAPSSARPWRHTADRRLGQRCPRCVHSQRDVGRCGTVCRPRGTSVDSTYSPGRAKRGGQCPVSVGCAVQRTGIAV